MQSLSRPQYGAAHQSIVSAVPAPNSEIKRCRKTKIGVNVPRAGVTGVPFFTSNSQMSGGRPQNMSALGRDVSSCLRVRIPYRSDRQTDGHHA